MSSSFDPTSLWNKSKIFISYAISARDRQEDELFYLWSSLALEILGKSCLASMHPTLVAKPDNFESLLLAATGQSIGTQHRSIMAKTVFERLAKLVPGFDQKATRDCLFFADRRNAELHSGETPFVGIDHMRVAPIFWSIAKKIVEGHDPPRSLEDWLGPDEAESVEAIIQDHQETITQTVLRRISRHEQEFDARYPLGSMERSELASSPLVDIVPSRFQSLGEHTWQVTCPACGLPGWAFGVEIDRDVIETVAEYERDGFGDSYVSDVYDLVEIFYEAEFFRCVHCDLHLDGLQELEIAEVKTESSVQTHDEHVFEPDYGND